MKNWIKQYWVYVAIAIFGGILGTAISLTIWHQNNIGTLAEWVSGIGSFGAIAFAYIQIKIQIKENQLAKRPIFSITCVHTLKEDFENYYVNDADFNSFWKASNPREDEPNGKKIRTLSNNRKGYKFENLSNEAALNICLEIKYDDKKESDIMTISSIDPKSEAAFFTHEMLSNKSENVYKDVHKKIEYIKLHFDSVIGVHYIQIWDQKYKITKPDGKEKEDIDMINYKIQETHTRPELVNTVKFHV